MKLMNRFLGGGGGRNVEILIFDKVAMSGYQQQFVVQLYQGPGYKNLSFFVNTESFKTIWMI